MKLNKLIQAMLLATPIILTACGGDDGKDGKDGTDGTNGTAGAAGATGAAGETGATGATGATGDNGLDSLVKQTVLMAGDDQCFQGGVRFDSGLDSNADGELATDEITESTVQCAATQLDTSSNFVRVATFPVCMQLNATCDDDTATSAEIIDVSGDGMTLVYTDSLSGVVGFVDITDPANPKALGIVDMDGEPTSVAVKDGLALVAVNTSADYVNTSGSLKVVDIATRTIVHSIDLGGQPDSVAISPDHTFAAVAIENERDEGLNDGQIDIDPQAPAGYLVVVNITDATPSNWTSTTVDMTGLADIAPTDPEPEYVDINEDNVAVVTMQENNHIVLVDLATATVTSHFNAGSVDLDMIDTKKNALIDQSSSIADVVREPDGVTWINSQYFVTADEGDMNGGSRTFTVFDTKGNIAFSSGNSTEHLTARIGALNEGRSGKKGAELENAEMAVFGNSRYLFVNSERSSLVLVYDIADPTRPMFKQVLPAALAPEGVKAIPSRNLLVAASEEDERGLFRGGVNIYSYNVQESAYPTISSVNRENGTPIPYAALSGLAADWSSEGVLWSIEDSAYEQSRIFRIDTNYKPARLTREIRIMDSHDVFAAVATSGASADDNSFDATDLAAMINDDKTVNLDPEGISVSAAGGFWVASEGAGTVGDASRPIKSLNFLFKVDGNGVIEQVVTLPDAINAKQVRFGFEGVSEYDGKLYVAFQRAWTGDTNPRIGVYDLTTKTWEFVFYPLDAVASQNGGWVGLSDISSLGDGTFLIIERDNQMGPDAAIKRLYKIDMNGYSADTTISKTLVRDLISDLKATGGLTPEKIEGSAVTPMGEVFIVNDNDGVDDNSGEIELLHLGNISNI